LTHKDMVADCSENAVSSYPAPSKGWYATILLTLAYTLSFIDRQILNLLAEPIRIDFNLSDTRISLLQGLAFISTYIVCSVPIGRLVDTRNRVWLLVGGATIWSIATTACGITKTYGQIFVSRMFVGIGEATLTPITWSLLADYFPPEKRERPISIFLIGPYLGGGIALIAGGYVLANVSDMANLTLPLVGEIRPWQFTFLAIGLPGLVFSLFLVTISEPKRQDTLSVSGDSIPLRDVARFILKRWRVYFAFLVGVPIFVIILYGLQAWVPTFLLRVHGMSLSDAGIQYGTVALVSGSTGVLTGPFLGRMLRRAGYVDYHLRIGIGAALLCLISVSMIPFTQDTHSTLLFIGLGGFAVTLPLALVASGLQTITPGEMRGVVAGLYVLLTSAFGMGLGPTAVALFTDNVFTGPTGLGLSLAVVCAIAAVLTILSMWFGLKPFREAMKAIDKDPGSG
jgi:MFS family permease